MYRLSTLAAEIQQWDSAIAWTQKALNSAPRSARLHHHLARLFKHTGQLDQAHAHYKTALYWDPHCPEIHHNFAVLLFKQNKLAAARHHYSQAIDLKPDYLEAHFNLGLLFLSEANQAAALSQFNQVLRLEPCSIKTHWQLAAMYWQDRDLEKVHAHYQSLLTLTPHSPELLNNLGALALQEEQLEQAIDYFKKALVLDCKHKNSRNNLAASLLQKNEFQESIEHYSLYLQLDPDDKTALYNRAQGWMLTGQLDKARDDLQKILDLDVNDLDAHCNLAAIDLKLGRKLAAVRRYQHIVHCKTEHPIASYMLSALTQQSIPAQPPLDYVKYLFDHYALHFDQHLQKILHYKTPEQLHELLVPHLHARKINILDLGCGTGLSGVPFAAIAATLTGIDISKKMLIQANTKPCYQTLLENDIVSGLSTLKHCYDLILCVDTLVYFGDLDEVFSNVVASLEHNGLFAFSVELPDTAIISYHLQTSGRYQHAAIYIEKLTRKNNLTCLKQHVVQGRYQENHFVKTGLFVLKKQSGVIA